MRFISEKSTTTPPRAGALSPSNEVPAPRATRGVRVLRAHRTRETTSETFRGRARATGEPTTGEASRDTEARSSLPTSQRAAGNPFGGGGGWRGERSEGL